MKAAIGFVIEAAYSAAASSIAPPISPTITTALVPWIFIERAQRIERRRADHRIAADAEKGRLADAGAREVEADERAEAAAARDHADLAGLKDVRIMPRHDADEALARRDEPAVFGPTIRVPAPRAASSIAMTSCAGMCSVRIDEQS